MDVTPRERLVRAWFDSWLRGELDDIAALFTPACTYIESWGPEYHGRQQVAHWFQEWNTRGRVLVWDIRQFLHQGGQSVVEWLFHCAMADGTEQRFEGLSLIRWAPDGRMAFLQEFGCNLERYNPYAAGGTPVFPDTKALWF